MGDERTYSHTIALRAVNSSDWVRIPYDMLEKVSNRIANEVDNLNRIIARFGIGRLSECIESIGS